MRRSGGFPLIGRRMARASPGMMGLIPDCFPRTAEYGTKLAGRPRPTRFVATQPGVTAKGVSSGSSTMSSRLAISTGRRKARRAGQADGATSFGVQLRCFLGAQVLFIELMPRRRTTGSFAPSPTPRRRVRALRELQEAIRRCLSFWRGARGRCRATFDEGAGWCARFRASATAERRHRRCRAGTPASGT